MKLRTPCFEKAKGLFQKWFLYGIGTLFSMGVLAFISSLVLQSTLRVAGALWSANGITGITGMGAEGITSQSMQQGGIGLLMTVLIVASPPLSAMFFQGTVGNFMHFSAFGGGMASRPGPQGQPPGSYGGTYMPPAAVGGQTNYAQQTNGAFSSNSGVATRLSGASSLAYADAIKPAPTQPPTGSAG